MSGLPNRPWRQMALFHQSPRPDHRPMWQMAGRAARATARLALIALVVGLGAAVVRHGTRALQEISGAVPPPIVQPGIGR